VYAGTLLGVAAGWQACRSAEKDGPAQWQWGLIQRGQTTQLAWQIQY
jgi:hypothetical protein